MDLRLFYFDVVNYINSLCNNGFGFTLTVIGLHIAVKLSAKHQVPANIYLFKVNNRNTRKRCEICSKLTIKTPDRQK